MGSLAGVNERTRQLASSRLPPSLQAKLAAVSTKGPSLAIPFGRGLRLIDGIVFIEKMNRNQQMLLYFPCPKRGFLEFDIFVVRSLFPLSYLHRMQIDPLPILHP